MAGILDLIDQGQPQAAAPTGPAPEPGLGDLVGKGFRQAVLSGTSGAHKIAGQAMDALGFDGSEQNAKAMRDRAYAQVEGQGMTPFEDVHDLKSGLRYGAGMLGGAAPVLAAGAGASLLTGGAALPAMIAGTAAMAPGEIGDQLYRQEEDPANLTASPASRLASAVPIGLGRAAAQNIIPAGVAARMVGGGAGNLGLRAVGDIAGNAAGSAASEGLSQYGDNQMNPQAGYNLDKIKSAGEEGAAGGAMFAGVGAAAHALHSKAGAIAEAPGKAVDAIKGLVPEKAAESGAEAPGGSAPAEDTSTTLGNLYKSAKDAGGHIMDRLAGGEETADPSKIAEAGDDPAKQAKVFDDADQGAMAWAKAAGTKLLDDNLSPEKAAEVKSALQTVSDKASQMTIATIAKGQETAKTVGDAITKFTDGVSDKLADTGTAKKSADYSGVRAKIGEAVTGVLGDDHPALADPKNLQKLADGLRPYIEQVASGKALDSMSKLDHLTALYDVLGDKTTAVLKAVHDAVGEPSTDKEAFFNTLNQIDAIQKGKQSILETQMKNLRPELQDSVRPSELKAEAAVLEKWAQSKSERTGGKAEMGFKDAQIKQALQHRYGDKADAVLAAVEKNVKKETNILDLTDTTERVAADGVSSVKYYAQNKQLYLHPDLDKGSNGFEGAAAQRLKTAQRDNPKATVQFRRASEIGLDDKMVKAKHADLVDEAKTHGMDDEQAKAHADKKIDDFGAVTAEQAKQETVINAGDLKAMSLDAKSFGKSPARIDAGNGVILDAIKMTEMMNSRLKDQFTTNDDSGRGARDANMFKEAVAAVTDHLGHSFEIPDSTKINKAGLTYGEAKKLDVRNEGDKASDASSKRIEQLRKEYRDAKSPKDRAEIAAEGKKLVGEKEWALIKEQAAEAPNTSRDEGAHEPDPKGNVHEALKGTDDPKGIIRTNDDGSARGDTVMGRRKPATSIESAKTDTKALDAMLAKEDYSSLKTGTDVKSFIERARERFAEMKKLDDGDNEFTPQQEKALAALYGMFGKGSKFDFDSLHPSFGVGEPPNPKELAAKKAALTEKAASGDKALLKELATSNDPKGLQRALDHLTSERKPNENTVHAIDTANARVAELIQQPGVAYGLLTRKYSMQSDVVHASLERPGFAATHDSPIKHEGKFDWRTHAMKGEGAMVKGAGTYLSTADGVHNYYKKAFTQTATNQAVKSDATYKVMRDRYDTLKQQALAFDQKDPARKPIVDEMRELGLKIEQHIHDSETKSPTYHVSVDIKPEEMMHWDKTIAEQPHMKEVFDKAVKEFGLKDWKPYGDDFTPLDDTVRAGDFYKELSVALSKTDEREGDRAASDWLQANGILGHEMKSATKEGMQRPNYVIYDDSKISTNYVHFSQERADPNASGPTDRKAVEAHIKDVLGPNIGVAWKNILHAGEFDRTTAGDVINLSIHSLNPMSTAYHESLHGFFARLKDAKQEHISAVLEKAGESAPVMNQLRKLLTNEPDALKQLTDPEERAAYMYQFWAQGKLSLGDKATTIFGRVAEFLRHVTGLLTNDERAEKIMAYFHSGEYEANRADPNAVNRALMESTASRAYEKIKAMTEPFREMGEALASAGGARLRDTGIPALRELADAMKLKTTTEGKDQGYLPAARAERSRLMNQIGTDLKPYSKDAIAEALEALQTGKTAPSMAGRTVAKMVSKRLAEALDYMQGAGVRISDIGLKDGTPYFPRSWDASYISSHQRQFRAMIDKYVASGQYVGSPDKLMQKLMVTDGAEFHINSGGLNKPGMQSAKERVLSFISHQDAAPFMRKNMYEVLNSYMTQATRRAEWARRFNDDGSGLSAMLDKAKTQGATSQQLDAARGFVQAVDGTLGDNINPTARRMMGNMIVYQNLRLLPLAIFSSAVDAQGIMVRGGTVGEAFKTFKRGMTEVVKNFQKEPSSDKMTQLAETLGVVDSAMLVHTLGASYSQGMVGNKGRAINDTFFRLNLMEQYNTSMRVGATEAAMNFIARHATQPGQHSVRFLRELGLEASDVHLDADGRPKLLQSQGLSLEHSALMKAAVNRWVDGAILRPDAVDKPIWMSDPHYALLAHLKQFVFAFHETILKRVAHEAQNGNFAPAMSLASYVPMMIAADMVKGMIQGGGSQPSWKDSWGPADYAWSGMERAGLFGVGQFGIDALGDVQKGGSGIGALIGPTAEQFTDALKTIGGREQFKTFAVKSMPANALYATALKQTATDPQFAD